MAYRLNSNLPRTRLRQPFFYKKKQVRSELIPSRANFSYTSINSTEVSVAGIAKLAFYHTATSGVSLSGIAVCQVTTTYNVQTSQIQTDGTGKIRSSITYNIQPASIQIDGVSKIRLTSTYNVQTSQIQIEGTVLLRLTANYLPVGSQVDLAGNGNVKIGFIYNVDLTRIQIAGSSLIRLTAIYQATSSGIQVAGVGVISNLPSYSYVGDVANHITLSGQASYNIGRHYVVDPTSVQTGGMGLTKHSFNYSASLTQLQIGGTANKRITCVLSGNGGCLIGGTSLVRNSYIYRVSGGSLLSGDASYYYQTLSSFIFVGDGGITCAGTARLRNSARFISNGGSVCSGVMLSRISSHYLSTGGLTTSGISLKRSSALFVGIGGIICGGISKNRASYHYSSHGGIVLNGSFNRKFIHVGTGGTNVQGVSIAAWFSPVDDVISFTIYLDFEYLDVLNFNVSEFYSDVYEEVSTEYPLFFALPKPKKKRKRLKTKRRFRKYQPKFDNFQGLIESSIQPRSFGFNISQKHNEFSKMVVDDRFDLIPIAKISKTVNKPIPKTEPVVLSLTEDYAEQAVQPRHICGSIAVSCAKMKKANYSFSP